MASEWFYSRDNDEHGPFSSGDLRSLAKKGDLLPTDYLWKKGMTDWTVAAHFPTLFPPKDGTATVIITPAEDVQPDTEAAIKIDTGVGGKKSTNAKSGPASADPLASLKLDVATAGKKATQAVKTHAKTVGKVAALTAERTKISTLTLPMAYAALGESCYQSRTHEKDFPDLFANLDAIQASPAEGKKKTIASGETIGEQAMAWAEQGMAFAKSQAQGVQAKTLLVQLGKACFNKFGPKAGPEELVAKVQSLKDRLNQIHTDRGISVKKSGGAKTWLVYGGGALLFLTILGAFVDDDLAVPETPAQKEPSGDEGTSSRAPSAPSSGQQAPPNVSQDEELKELFRQSRCMAGMSPEALQSLLRSTAKSNRSRWGAFQSITPSKTEKNSSGSDFVQLYGTTDSIKCGFRRNDAASQELGLWVVFINRRSIRLMAKPKCSAWALDVRQNREFFYLILHIPIPAMSLSLQAKDDLFRARVQEAMRASVRGFKPGQPWSIQHEEIIGQSP